MRRNRKKNGATAQSSEKRLVLNGITGFWFARSSLARFDAIKRLCVCVSSSGRWHLGVWVQSSNNRAQHSLSHAHTQHRLGMDLACVRSVCEGSWKRHRGVFYLLFVAPVCVQVNGCLSAHSAAESTARRTQKQVNLFECRFSAVVDCFFLLFGVSFFFLVLFCFAFVLRVCVCVIAYSYTDFRWLVGIGFDK